MCKRKEPPQKTARNKLENLFDELDKYLSDSNLVSSLLYYTEPQNNNSDITHSSIHNQGSRVTERLCSGWLRHFTPAPPH